MNEDYVTRILATLHKSPKSKDVIQKYIKSPRYFNDKIDQEIYSSLITFDSKDTKVEPVTVHKRIADKSITLQQVQIRMNEFREYPILNQLDMTAVLSKLISDITAEKVTEELDTFKLRVKQNVNIFELCDNLVKKVTDIRQFTAVSEMKDKQQQVDNYINDLNRRRNGEIQLISYFTKGLQEMLGGTERGNLIYICARPEMGKTQYAVQCINHYAGTLGLPTALFCLEMSEVEMIRRFVTNGTGISPDRQLDGNISDDEMNVINRYMVQFKKMPLTIDDFAPVTLNELENKINHYVHFDGVEVVLIDYVGLILPSEKSGNKVTDLEAISQRLKLIAKKLKIVVVGFLQLNRNGSDTMRNDPRPILSDIKGTGSYEQDADTVLFIHRPSMYKAKTQTDSNESRYITEIILGKHRLGRKSHKSIHKIIFDPVYQTFKDYDELAAEQELKEIQKYNKENGII